jgi:tungstate transport system substrate-binding protein
MIQTAIALIVALTTASLADRAVADDDFILMQSTTSTQNSGLFQHLLPQYQMLSGTEVRVVAVGTGQALKNARDGNGDLVMVHARKAEEKFVSDGYGVIRHPVMYNEFVIIGPDSDPATLAAAGSATEALRRIAASAAPFVSRGDDSGTHKRELELWAAAQLAPDAATDEWYKDTGSGMGRTLSIAVELGAYTLTDRATWLAHQKRGDHRVLFSGDRSLFNQYSVIKINPRRYPSVRADAAQAFIDWLIGPRGQAAIAAFRLAGEQLFFPNADTNN